MKQQLEVMIVDDEPLIANLLKNSIDWNSIGLYVDRVAHSASEALALIEEKCPHIIFTDIHMPRVNGLDFSRQVLLEHPSVKIIVLTGHDDFEYAREAVGIGILEYIQKPINAASVESAALKAKEIILKDRNLANYYGELREELVRNMTFLREKFLYNLITGNVNKQHINQAMKYYDVKPDIKYIAVAILKVIANDLDDEEAQLLPHYNALKILKEKYEQTNALYLFQDPLQRIIVLSFEEENVLSDCCYQISNYLTQDLHYTVSIGIGKQYSFDADYKKSYAEASAALKYAIVNEEDSIIYAQDLQFSKNEIIKLNLESIEDLIFFVRTGVSKQAEETLQKIIEQIASYDCSLQTVKTISSGIVSGITESIILSGLEGLDAITNQAREISKICAEDHEDNIIAILSEFILETTKKIEGIRQSSENHIILQVKQYLAEHFQDPGLSLLKVSNLLSYNQNYLSRLFKQETGKTFSEYLLSIRMSKAIQLVTKTDLRSYQIAEQVGFVDPNYFSLCFKKYTSKNISDYRSKN